MYDDDPVRVYVREVCNVPPISGEQEAECVRRIRAKDEGSDLAMKDLVEANLARVVTIAQRHPSERIHILDLIQSGNNALMAAVIPFVDCGAENFSAYAAPFIENAIIHRITTPGC